MNDQATGADQNTDSWDRFFNLAEQMYHQGMEVSETCSRICDIMMTRVIEGKLPFYLKRVLLEHDRDAETDFRNRGQDREILFVSCEGLVKNDNLMADMRSLLALIQEEYQYPVDIEYTINMSETGEYVINLLQCRPLQVAQDREKIAIPERPDSDKVFLECSHASMGLSKKIK